MGSRWKCRDSEEGQARADGVLGQADGLEMEADEDVGLGCILKSEFDKEHPRWEKKMNPDHCTAVDKTAGRSGHRNQLCSGHDLPTRCPRAWGPGWSPHVEGHAFNHPTRYPM